MTDLERDAEDLAIIDSRTAMIEARWDEQRQLDRAAKRKTERDQMLWDVTVLCVYALLMVGAMSMALWLKGGAR